MHSAPDLLRRHTHGVLEFLDRTARVRFVLASNGTAVVFPAPAALADEPGPVLFVPSDEHGPDTVQLLLRIAPVVDWRLDADCDRWQAYHGRPDGPVWFRAAIDSAKHAGAVWEGHELNWANPLSTAEPGLCRAANADRSLLTRAVGAHTRLDLNECLVVGFDPWGIDVRHTSGVFRVSLEPPAADAPAARAVLEAILRRG